MDDETAGTVTLPLERRETATSSILPAGRSEITPEDECGCHLCQTGMPGKDGYRPHTATSSCWCLGAEYDGCCEVGKQFGDEPPFPPSATGHTAVRSAG
jgi:hypothetical protein